MNYTEGEWYWDFKDNKAFNLRAKSKHPSGCAVDEHILFIADDFLGENSLNNEADASLIAVAPKMYEELKQVNEMFLRVKAVRPLKGYEQVRHRAVFQLLAKAEGGK